MQSDLWIYSAPLFLCVFVISVVKLAQLNGGGVVKTEPDSELDDVPGRTVTSSRMPLYSFILLRTTEGLKGINPVFLKADLLSFSVKVLLENC